MENKFEGLLNDYQEKYQVLKAKHKMLFKIIEAMDPGKRRELVNVLSMNIIAEGYYGSSHGHKKRS